MESLWLWLGHVTLNPWTILSHQLNAMQHWPAWKDLPFQSLGCSQHHLNVTKWVWWEGLFPKADQVLLSSNTFSVWGPCLRKRRQNYKFNSRYWKKIFQTRKEITNNKSQKQRNITITTKPFLECLFYWFFSRQVSAEHSLITSSHDNDFKISFFKENREIIQSFYYSWSIFVFYTTVSFKTFFQLHNMLLVIFCIFLCQVIINILLLPNLGLLSNFFCIWARWFQDISSFLVQTWLILNTLRIDDAH